MVVVVVVVMVMMRRRRRRRRRSWKREKEETEKGRQTAAGHALAIHPRANFHQSIKSQYPSVC